MVDVGGGRYELRERLGGGGMGDVWSAEDKRMGRSVAVKLLRDHHFGDEGMKRRFLREWQVTAGLEHENVVRAYDCGWDKVEGRPVMYLVMQRLSGVSLKERLSRGNGRKLPLDHVVRWGEQICGALSAAHGQGLVHRDLKPANVQITESGDAVLLDFGIACFQEDDEGRTRVTPVGWAVGTPEYMSPEQARGESVGAASDLYSLGCVLYEMVTGRRPFEGGDAARQHQHAVPREPRACGVPDLPADLNDLVMALLEKDPQCRPATADEVGRRLGRISRTPQRQARTRPRTRSAAPAVDTRGPNSRTPLQSSSLDSSQPDVSPSQKPAARAVSLPHRTRHQETYEIAGGAALSGLSTCALLTGAGGFGTKASLLWGLLAAVALLVVGAALEADIGDGENLAAGCAGMLALAGVIGGTWLAAVKASFPWYADLAMGLGVGALVFFLGVTAGVYGATTGSSEGAAATALLNAMQSGFLGAVFLAVCRDFTWWTTLLGGLGLWAAGLCVVVALYKSLDL